MRDRDLTARLAQRAAAAGAVALVLTADTPVVARKHRTARAGAVSKDHFLAALGPGADAGSAEQAADITFEEVSRLRRDWGLPVVVKGVLRADDAEAAVAAGAAGLVVSNHGGRQLDGAVSTAGCLSQVVAAVAGRAEVYVDGGVRTGTDVLRALAMGARAVLVGRPVLWGLAVDGADGVHAVLDGLAGDLSHVMALAGAPTARPTCWSREHPRVATPAPPGDTPGVNQSRAARPTGGHEALGGSDVADVVVVGAGGAGLTVLHALAHRDLTIGLPRPVRVVVVDPVADTDTVSRHRTWCFWAAGEISVAPAVHASWQHVRVSDDTRDLVLDLDPYRYHLVRSDDLAALVAEQVARAPRLQVERVVAPAEQVVSCGDHAHVEVMGRSIRAGLVLDSRPVRPARSGSVFWWQHFRGWTLPAGSLPERRHPGPVASLMDFRTSQPDAGLSFGYLLPLPDGRALAEYTEFSPTRLDDTGYDRALRGYLDLLGVAHDTVPDHVETGAIPMTDGTFTRRSGARVARIGTAGGATRGATGYTFAAMLRDGAAVADLVAAGALDRPGPVCLPPLYPARHRWMDGIQLQALDAGRIDGPTFFTDLFARRPAGQVLRFLDGTTDLVEDLGIMAASPTLPMSLTAVHDGLARVRRGLGRRRAEAVPAVPVTTTARMPSR